MSGFTTTGASVIESVNDMSHGMHMWRAMTQWIGGMGIILFTLALLPMLNYSGGLQLFNAEMTGLTHDKIQPRINQTAKTLWLMYTGLTVLLIGLLCLGPMSFFDSMCHAFGTISTGGYSSHSDGMTLWHDSVYIKCVMIVFMFLGGVNFGLLYKLLHGKFKALLRNDVFKTFVGIIFVMLGIFALVITLRGQGIGDARPALSYSVDHYLHGIFGGQLRTMGPDYACSHFCYDGLRRMCRFYGGRYENRPYHTPLQDGP